MWYRYRNYAVRDVLFSLSLLNAQNKKINPKNFLLHRFRLCYLFGGCFPEGNLETFIFTFSRVMLEVHGTFCTKEGEIQNKKYTESKNNKTRNAKHLKKY